MLPAAVTEQVVVGLQWPRVAPAREAGGLSVEEVVAVPEAVDLANLVPHPRSSTTMFALALAPVPTEWRW